MKECNCFACKQQKEYENSITGMYEVPIYKCINQKEMKTKTIEVKFPTIEGMKVENASVDLKNGLSVVEYVEDAKFKKGDVIYSEFGVNEYIMIYDKVKNTKYGCDIYGVAKYIYSFNKDNMLTFNSYIHCDLSCFRLATDSEKQLLFDALEKDGKYWDSESLEVKELSVNDRIDRILFDIKNCGESVVDASEKIRNIIDKEVNKAVNEIYKNI